MRSLITTIGIEIEFGNIQKTHARKVSAETGWSLIEDGSTRSFRYALGGLTIDTTDTQCPHCGFGIDTRGRGPATICGQCGKSVQSNLPWERSLFGGEFVSPMMDTDTDPWVAHVTRILNFLSQHGEGVDARTSIHVHVNCNGLPLFAMQQLITVGCYLEAAMYRLACAEAGVHRGGLAYDYGYCRPITSIGPPVTATNTEARRQIFSVDALLRAEDWTEFKQALGRYDAWGGGKYHEARYVWLNPVSFFVRGSMEFRIFNSTLQPRYVEAWVEVCKKIVQASFGKDNDLPRHPLGGAVDSDLDLLDVVEFLGITENRTIYTLEELWNAAPYQRPPQGLQCGHTGQRVNWARVPQHLRPSICNPSRVLDFGSAPQQTELLRGVVSPGVLNLPTQSGRRRVGETNHNVLSPHPLPTIQSSDSISFGEGNIRFADFSRMEPNLDEVARSDDADNLDGGTRPQYGELQPSTFEFNITGSDTEEANDIGEL